MADPFVSMNVTDGTSLYVALFRSKYVKFGVSPVEIPFYPLFAFER